MQILTNNCIRCTHASWTSSNDTTFWRPGGALNSLPTPWGVVVGGGINDLCHRTRSYRSYNSKAQPHVRADPIVIATNVGFQIYPHAEGRETYFKANWHTWYFPKKYFCYENCFGAFSEKLLKTIFMKIVLVRFPEQTIFHVFPSFRIW